MFARLTVIATLAFAPMAAAQTPPEPAASPEQIAAATARADDRIAAAEAGGIFVNKTDSAVAEVEHVASGLRCLLGEEAEDRIHIFPSASLGIPRGDDVACINRDDATGMDVTVYATRYPGGMTVDGIMSGAISGIRQRWPDAVPYTGELTSATVEGLTTPATAAFKIRVEGQEMLTMVIGAQEGDWSFKIRITGPYQDAMAVSLYGSIAMAYVQTQLKED